jgi:hypothetical protein
VAVTATPFVPATFEVPLRLATSEFTLRKLTVDDVIKDYEAVMSSVSHLRTVWPDGTWPEGLTLRQNLIDLGWHEKEFQLRQSFAFTVLSPLEERAVGCVYVYPSTKVGHDAEVYLWARQSELESGLEDRLYDSVRNWLEQDWPFSSVAFPGRSVTWVEWSAKGDQLR